MRPAARQGIDVVEGGVFEASRSAQYTQRRPQSRMAACFRARFASRNCR
ncbi:MAG: hypothetical protein ACLGIK_05560 [Gemmatimonadota bacterium]